MQLFIGKQQILPDRIRKITSEFDLNSSFDDWVSTSGDENPKNAPADIGWACFKTFNLSSDTAIQIGLGLNYNSQKSTMSLYSRIKANNNWQDWKKTF